MRGLLAAALALALAGAPLAAQATHGKHPSTRTERERRARRPVTRVSTDADMSARASATTRLRLWSRGALLLATRLAHKQESTPEQMRSDVNALGRNITDARAALEDLRKHQLPDQKARLDSVRSHLNDARKRYGDLVKAWPDSDRVALHAAEVREELVAAETTLTGRPPTLPSAAPRARRTPRPRHRSKKK